MLCFQERFGCKDCCDASGPQFLEVNLAQWLNSLPIMLFVTPPPKKKEAIKITLYRWVELGGIGVEWVWRGYNFSNRKPILAISGKTEFS